MSNLNTNGVILHTGASLIDGSPIVVVLTGLTDGSANAKTGDRMLQTWIIRADMSPSRALEIGADAAICGGCTHRGDYSDGIMLKGSRTCYVRVSNAPRAVYECYSRNGYPTWDQWRHTVGRGKSRRTYTLAEWLRLKGFVCRLGSYGDPMAVPASIWQTLLPHMVGHTGYTHQWRDYPRSEAYKSFLQASCDGMRDYIEASAHGWGTFLVLPRGAAIPKGHAHCAASAERNHLTTCGQCLLCDGAGNSPTAVAIHAHGATAGKVVAQV